MIKLIKNTFYNEKKTKAQLCNFIKSSDYLSLLLMAANSELYFENFEHVFKLLIKAIPLAKEREKKEIFMQFLGVKARYCYLAAINNIGNEEILDRQGVLSG